MSSTEIWIHTVWVTKQRRPYFDKALLYKLGLYLKKQALFHSIQLDYVNGYKDHLHLLIQLRSTQTMAGVNKQMKGESSRWINTSALTDELFSWRAGYYAASVSPRHVEQVREYIKNQWKKHEHLNLKQELSLLFPFE